MTRGRFRLTLARMMVLIAVVAVGLWAYRLYHDPERVMTRRARVSAKNHWPGPDYDKYNVELGPVFGEVRLVTLTDPKTEKRRRLAMIVDPYGSKPTPQPLPRRTASSSPRTPPPSPSAPSGSPPTGTP